MLTPSLKFTFAFTLRPSWANATLSIYVCPDALKLKSLAVIVEPVSGVIVINTCVLVSCISLPTSTSKVEPGLVVLAIPVKLTVTVLSLRAVSPDIAVNWPIPWTLNSLESKFSNVVASPLIWL